MTVTRPTRKTGHAAAEAALRAHALAKPGATEHFPWGERAIKVAGKVFLFLSADTAQLSLSTKLPASHGLAVMLPFAEPTGYGLGRAGWVSASFEPKTPPPLELLCAWIDESYQAIAPAKLARLAAGGDAPAAAKPTAKRPAAKRPAAKQPAAKQPAAKQPATKQPAARQPAAKQPAAKQPAAKQPAAKRPAAKRPAAKQPAQRR